MLKRKFAENVGKPPLNDTNDNRTQTTPHLPAERKFCSLDTSSSRASIDTWQAPTISLRLSPWNGKKREILGTTLLPWAPVVTSIKFLRTISGHNQDKKSWDLKPRSLKKDLCHKKLTKAS